MVVENRKEGEVSKRKGKRRPNDEEKRSKTRKKMRKKKKTTQMLLCILPISSSMFAFLFPNYTSREILKTDCKTLYTNFTLICREFRLH